MTDMAVPILQHTWLPIHCWPYATTVPGTPSTTKTCYGHPKGFSELCGSRISWKWYL